MRTFCRLLPLLSFLAACSHSATKPTSDISVGTGKGASSFAVSAQRVRNFVAGGPAHKSVFIPEGEFIVVFHPKAEEWAKMKWTAKDVAAIRDTLHASLEIPLTQRGFVEAATRLLEGEKDDTNYNAIWVRDSAWIALSFLDAGEADKARRLVLALWDYYAQPHQLKRFDAVIAKPSLRDDPMAVPHIRFDGTSPTMEDVQVDGKAQSWNHKQIDAHGLFLLALARAVERNLVLLSDLNAPTATNRAQALARFPTYFSKINYTQYAEAGAWEEIDRRNSSSVAIVAKALHAWKDLNSSPNKDARDFLRALRQKLPGAFAQNWGDAALTNLADQGVRHVRNQLSLGGESPDYAFSANPQDLMSFRRADAALFNLVLPFPLKGLSEEDLRTVAWTIESLKRPAGILRYQADSYQAGNFWIQEPNAAPTSGAESGDTKSGLTDDSSSFADFMKRFSNMPPFSEAQWFFDSKQAMIWLELAKIDGKKKDPLSVRRHENDVRMAILHVKRALGQLTGPIGGRPLITADGHAAGEFLIPESINTVIVDGRSYLLPSPIVPLNWAKASLAMALKRLQDELTSWSPRQKI